MIIALLNQAWVSWQIRKITGAHAPGMPGTFSPPPQVRDPDMHLGKCVTHVPWYIPGSLTSSFLWSRRVGKRFRYSRRIGNPKFYVSGKRPMTKGVDSWHPRPVDMTKVPYQPTVHTSPQWGYCGLHLFAILKPLRSDIKATPQITGIVAWAL